MPLLYQVALPLVRRTAAVLRSRAGHGTVVLVNLLRTFVDTVADRAVVPGYSRIGFALRKQWWEPLPDNALAGKRAIVTGAGSGLGEACATGLARLGATVHLAVRSPEKGEDACERILAEVPGADLEVDECDVSDPASMHDFAAGFLAEHPKLAVLVHNAGLLPPERKENGEGDEITLATHVLGPHLLTGLLRPALAEAGGRVVFVSSGGMYAQKLHDEDLQFRHGQYRGASAYARTKRMQVVLARRWATELAPDGIAVHSMHPGWAATPGVTDSLPGFARFMAPLLRTAEEGADTTVWLAASAEGGRESGGFWHDRARRPEHYLPLTAETPEQVERLWTFCVERTGMG